MQNHYVFDECFLPGEALLALTKKLPTPFYLYDEAGLRQAAQRLRRAFSWNSRHRQFFPLRLTPNPQLLQILREEGCGVQCGGLAELMQAQRCGFHGDEIIFAPMYPGEQELTLMRQLDTTLLLGNLPVAELCESLDTVPTRVLLRYNPGGKFTVGLQSIARPERSKLGMSKAEVITMAGRLRKRGVKKLGLEADLTKQALEPDYCAAVAKLLFDLAGEIKDITGTAVDFLNLGDGMGLGFLPEQENPDILVQGERTRIMIQSLCESDCPPIHTSIGRHLTGPNGILVSRVLCVKRTYRNFVVLDAAVSNFMRAAQGAYHHVSVVGKTQSAGRIYCDVVGWLPELEGRFAERRLLPPVERGDCLVIHDAGFCGSAMETNYGGAPRCAEYLYAVDGSTRLIRPAQSPTDCLTAW